MLTKFLWCLRSITAIMWNMEPGHGPEELNNLALLRVLQRLLKAALDSLGNKTGATPQTHYLAWAANSVNVAADAYLYLRESCRVPASKVLLRLPLEAVFATLAVMQNPRYLFFKAYSEIENDIRLVAQNATAGAAATEQLHELERRFEAAYPGEQFRGTNIRECAQIAGQVEAYDVWYRLYCQFTHGALRATVGALNDVTDVRDTNLMSWCVLMMLEQLKQHTPADVPGLDALKSRLADAFNKHLR
jgi:hypothetical protein